MGAAAISDSMSPISKLPLQGQVLVTHPALNAVKIKENFGIAQWQKYLLWQVSQRTACPPDCDHNAMVCQVSSHVVAGPAYAIIPLSHQQMPCKQQQITLGHLPLQQLASCRSEEREKENHEESAARL